jgi:hypothetical protein
MPVLVGAFVAIVERLLRVGSGLSGYRRIFNLPSCYAGLNGRVWPEPVVQGLLATVELTRINRPASKNRTAALGQLPPGDPLDFTEAT